MTRLAFAVLGSALLGIAITPAWAAVDAGLLEMVPPNAEVLYGVQVQPVIATAFGKAAYARVLANNPAIDRFAGLLGLDPKRDIHELLLVTLPGSGPQGSGQKLARFDLILVRGNFRPDRFQSVARLSGGSVVDDHGVITLAPIARTMRHSVMLLNSSTAAIGPAGALRDLLARKSAKTLFAGALAQKATAVAAANDLWFASTGTPVAQVFGNRSWLPGALAGAVRETDGGVKFAGDSAKVSAEAVTTSEALSQTGAQALSAAVRLIKNARTAPLRGAQFSANGTAVQASLATNSQDLERLLLKPAAGSTLRAGVR